MPSARNAIRFDRRFYLAASLVFLALVFWTFARTFFLRPLFIGTPLPLRLHIHGAVMMGWVVLLVVQSGLVAFRRVGWHRWLGALGAAWAVLVVILGASTTVLAAARDVHAHAADAPVKVMIMGLELVQMLLFAAFVAAAVLLRRRPDYHKRLMLLTIACMLPSVLARLPIESMSNLLILGGLNLSVLACVGIDTLRYRRIHPAFATGASLFLVSINAMFVFAQTQIWVSFGTWLVS